jgi:transcriptional regulator with XRE-family HTH domain
LRSQSHRIRQARRTSKLTQTGLAQKLGVSRSAVAQWENPGGSQPSTANLARLAGALECSFEWLATGRSARSAAPGEHIDAAVVMRHFARDDVEEHLLGVFRALDEVDRQAVVAMADALSLRQRPSRRKVVIA